MMSEVQENVLDDQNPDYTDLESLLAAANSSEFSISNGFTEEKQEFEKLNSFFEIVTSNDTKNLNNEDEVLDDLQVGSETDEEGELEISGLQVGSDADEEGELEISGLQVGSDADEEDELEISGVQAGSDADEDLSKVSGLETALTEEEQLAYDKGYKAALEEFEKAMSLEKGSLKDLTETMFSIGDDFQESLEALIKTKICELNNELLESELQDFPTPFLNKIKQVAGDIVSEIKDVKLELNHADLELLKGSDVVKNLGFELMERSDLRRGEFRLISNSTGFQRELSH
jgi:flagellar biosynthesis/type III secretory pathway protein FliH